MSKVKAKKRTVEENEEQFPMFAKSDNDAGGLDDDDGNDDLSDSEESVFSGLEESGSDDEDDDEQENCLADSEEEEANLSEEVKSETETDVPVPNSVKKTQIMDLMHSRQKLMWLLEDVYDPQEGSTASAAGAPSQWQPRSHQASGRKDGGSREAGEGGEARFILPGRLRPFPNARPRISGAQQTRLVCFHCPRCGMSPRLDEVRDLGRGGGEAAYVMFTSSQLPAMEKTVSKSTKERKPKKKQNVSADGENQEEKVTSGSDSGLRVSSQVDEYEQDTSDEEVGYFTSVWGLLIRG
ncbi:hypothetical protein P4O66_003617 [Electrophorus voltai]|uniref:Uncharacterized protein n=1 Tax=Electrophorus voltai TaxID=2609070 RepID=A0AAD9E530_9TELE|nr:hypothetical protein P4O66_003617 [Electrophorus voltai]